MNKAELKAAWGKYCDTDKLVDDMMALLTKYHHKNTEHGVCTMLNVYFENKHDLIELFQKSPNYIGDMRIVFDIELERNADRNEVWNFVSRFSNNVEACKSILKYKDDNGKELQDYEKTGIMSFKASDLMEEDLSSKFKTRAEKRAQFTIDGSTKASYITLADFDNIIYDFRNTYTPTIGEGLVSRVTNRNKDIRISEGQKTSRAFNRVCTYYGVDKCPNYNKLFAQYADMVSGLKRKLKFFMSLNPLDYLTMSFGVSWASCHTIDKKNERHMPDSYSGQYCGGTVSYMLDSTSFVTYVHKDIPDDVEEGKIYRCMFHYNNGMLIQGRIYPQGNDGATDLYKIFRGFVQKNLSEMLGIANSWTKKSGCTRDYTATHGVHYTDYIHFGDCNASYLKEIPGSDSTVVNIGHERICPKCGYNIANTTNSGILVHGTCPT